MNLNFVAFENIQEKKQKQKNGTCSIFPFLSVFQFLPSSAMSSIWFIRINHAALNLNLRFVNTGYLELW